MTPTPASPLRWTRFRAPAGTPPPAAATPAGTVVYAIGDVHGRADLLATMQRGIALDAQRRRARRRVVVYLGDYISRGPDSRRVLEQVIAWRPDGFEIVALKGNHEQLLLRYLDGDLMIGRHWLGYGASEALAAYGVALPRDVIADDALLTEMRHRLVAAMPEAHVRFVRSLATGHREGGYLFAHAGILPGVALDAQRERDLVWIRGRFLRSADDHGAVVVHGHSITEEPQVRHNRIGIDTGAYRSGVLTCLVLDGRERAFLQTVGDAPPRGSG
ncbi:MAG TPA: metallophosphoesterase [Rhodocyclaceae bacterium]|nr:metallophosphoesterase [Rhodocyclaceae bacterium]